jgi:hypothetical protein
VGHSLQPNLKLGCSLQLLRPDDPKLNPSLAIENRNFIGQLQWVTHRAQPYSSRSDIQGVHKVIKRFAGAVCAFYANGKNCLGAIVPPLIHIHTA